MNILILMLDIVLFKMVRQIEAFGWICHGVPGILGGGSPEDHSAIGWKISERTGPSSCTIMRWCCSVEEYALASQSHFCGSWVDPDGGVLHRHTPPSRSNPGQQLRPTQISRSKPEECTTCTTIIYIITVCRIPLDDNYAPEANSLCSSPYRTSKFKRGRRTRHLC